MIFDYQDIATKLYIAYMVRKWVNTGANSMIILQNPRVKEITEADLSMNSTDDVVWTCLFLIGAGLLRYIVKDNGKKFDLALDPHWDKPAWLQNRTYVASMNRHCDFLMELVEEHLKNVPSLTPFVPSLQIIQYKGWCKRPPKEPNRNLEREKEIIEKNRRLYRAKLRFHRGY